MGAGNHGGFGATKGRAKTLLTLNLQFFGARVFEKGGYISKESFENHREFFLGKSVQRLKYEMAKQGYITRIENSVHPLSNARKLVVLNPSKERNVAVVHVSPGSKRHGETSYVRVCTNDIGKFKVVTKMENYKTDGREKALIYPARRK